VDGNNVEASYDEVNEHTEWHVKMAWQLRGLVKTVNYYSDADASYSAYVECNIAVEDEEHNWGALTTYADETAQIVNESVFDKDDAIVSVDEMLVNEDEVAFLYDLQLDAHAEINRPEMSLSLRGEPFGDPFVHDDGGVHNAGWIQLKDRNTGEFLIKRTKFW
jgi:hypothetical protein